MRAFSNQSILTDGTLALALAPALTPGGIDSDPRFFQGFAVHPQVLARGFLVLADITSTRYFNYTPVAQRDPVLSGQGDRLRAECFSACNGVYARLDLLQSGFDGQIGFGTSNVDIGMELRAALANIRREDKLHVLIGDDGLKATRIANINTKTVGIEKIVHERAVQMPDRWVRALGNAAEIHQAMRPVFSIKGVQAQAFVASLPPATGKTQAGWLTPSRAGVKLMPRRGPGAAYVSGLHRLSALKRIMTSLSGMTFYMRAGGEPGPFMVEAALPCARLTLSLTAESWQGYSGEGALLASLARQDVLADAGLIGQTLGFDAAIDALDMARRLHRSETQVQAALALLAVSGKLGFDARDGAYFHRELPDDPDRVLKDNPRLTAARKLVDKVERMESTGNKQWIVHSSETDYRVYFDPALGAAEARCTCTWYLNHQNKRGPCKHILAVQLKEGLE
ncbi:hypothetical protein AGMMS50256_07060 [Betaproteobacteria bacterium]|nr:hypothetical protein AGMMS50256_07060 [Betaproteobacteria bacterium]